MPLQGKRDRRPGQNFRRHPCNSKKPRPLQARCHSLPSLTPSNPNPNSKTLTLHTPTPSLKSSISPIPGTRSPAHQTSHKTQKPDVLEPIITVRNFTMRL